MQYGAHFPFPLDTEITKTYTIDRKIVAKGINTMEQQFLQGIDLFPLFDAALEIIIIFEPSGTICYANKQAKDSLGYGKALLGASLWEIFPPGRGLSPAQLELIEEGVLYRRNGTCFPVRVSVCPNGRQNVLFAMNVAVQTETERKLIRMKEEMQEALKVRNEFVANVTHELRTPVNGIRGHASALREGGVTKEQGRTLDIITRCCDNMSAIINNILDFSKLEAGKFTIEQKEFHFRRMVQHTVETNLPAVDAKGLHLLVNVDKGIPEYLVGDELRLAQILNNLISNAVKFTSVGYISIEVTKTLEFDDEVELFFVVSDTGIGISLTEKDKLFQSFSQVDASITRKYGGTGLGLAITRQLVERMHGAIRVDSEKGKGSSFSFSVRLHQAQGSSQESKGQEEFEFLGHSQELARFDSMQEVFRFGSKENIEEISSKMEKLVLCMEVGAWEKAEVFTHNIKSFVEQGPKDIKKAAFRLEMTVRREDLAKSMEQYGKLKELLQAQMQGQKPAATEKTE